MSTPTATQAAAEPAVEGSEIMLQASPRIEILPFAVAVPASSTMEPIAFEDDYESDDDDNATNAAATNAREMADDFLELPKNKPIPAPPVANPKAMEGMGLVGTIIVLQTSYVVWFGWGKLEDDSTSSEPRTGVNNSRVVGSSQGSDSCQMGQFLVAMPPKPFSGGAFLSSDPMETSTSKLIGGDEDDMIARQMASRLSQKSGKPVLVSCHLDSAHVQSMGLDPDLLHARASALAEQQIWKMLQEHPHAITTTNK